MAPLASLFAAFSAGLASAQPSSNFVVASVKPSTGCREDGAGRGGAGGSGDPGRLDVRRQTVMDLLDMAYWRFANGKRNLPPRPITVLGAPPWIDSERYDIEANFPSTTSFPEPPPTITHG